MPALNDANYKILLYKVNLGRMNPKFKDDIKIKASLVEPVNNYLIENSFRDLNKIIKINQFL